MSATRVHKALEEAWSSSHHIVARLKHFLADVRIREIVVDVEALSDGGKNEDKQQLRETFQQSQEARLSIVYNPKRNTEKRKPSPDLVLVNQPWKDAGFNFFKIPNEEVVYSSDIFRVVYNLFPICEHHFIMHSQMQSAQNYVSPETLPFLIAAIDLAIELRKNRWMLIFNSFGAFASVNHLHTQILPHPIHSGGCSMVEAAHFEPFAEHSWGSILAPAHDHTGYHVGCVVFELRDQNFLEEYAEALRKFLQCLAEADMAHNFFSLDVPNRPFRIAVYPRRCKSFATPDVKIVPGGFEIFGMPIVFDSQFFDSFTEQDYYALRDATQLDQNSMTEILAWTEDN